MKKLRIWILAAICLATLAGCLITSRAANTDDIVNGDVVKIGSYPQTRVTNSSLINTLNGVSKTWNNYPYYSKNTSGGNYPTKLDKTMMDYADFTYNGVKYRAVRINKYRPNDVTKVPDSEYTQQQNGYIKGTIYYFIWEPVEWVVLDKGNGIVISKKVLDAQPFNDFFREANSRYMSAVDDSASASAWHYATVRYWLNGEDSYYDQYANFNFYYSAFSSSERSAIRSQMHEYTCELQGFISYDSVFLPLETEVTKYKSFVTSAENTDYAESQGKSKPGSSGGNYWYTSKAANDKKMYYCVDQTTSFSDERYSRITSTITGIRPMLKLDLSSDAVIGPFTIHESSILYRCPHILWDEQTDAQSYDVYRCPGNVDPATTTAWTKLTTTALEGTATSYTDNSAVTENSYYYYVTKYTSSGSEKSKPVKGYCKLYNPTVSVSNNADGKPVLSWTSVDKADGYLVYRKTVNESTGVWTSWTQLVNDPVTSRTYTDTTAQAGKEYGYWVRSYSNLGSSYYSMYKWGNGNRASCKLGTPQPTVSTWPNGKPRISWDPVAGDEGTEDVYYRVYYRCGSETGWTSVAYTYGSGFTHGGSSNTETCYYYVKAHNKNWDEAYDSEDSAVISWEHYLQIFHYPESVSVKAGQTATFTVSAGGVGLQYQWQYRTSSSGEWKDCTSATEGYNTATLKVVGKTYRHGYQYRCCVTNNKGLTSESGAATLSVLGIKKQAVSVSTTAGKTASFTIVATGTGKTYQWQWRTSSTGTWHNSTSATAGYHSATLKVSAATSRHGYQYRCKVTDSAGNTVTSKAVPPIALGIKTAPASVSTTAGNTAAFKVVATGAGKTYQWQYRTSSSGTWKNCTSATEGYHSATLKVEAKAYRNGYQYRCKVKDSAGNTVTSKAATLTVK